MKHRPILWNAVFVTLQSAAIPAWAQSAQPPTAAVDTTTQSHDLFRKGLVAYNAGQIEEAYQLFLEVWSMRPSADVAMQLAQAEIALGKFADGAGHLDFALHNFTPSINDKMRGVARQAYAEALRRVTKLNIMVSPAGAEVLVNGRSVGESPLGGPIYADAGTCIVEARLDDVSTTKTLLAESGKEATVALALSPPAQTPAQASAPTPPLQVQAPAAAEPKPSAALPAAERSLVLLLVGGVVAVAGIGTGVGLRLASNSADDHAKTLLAKVGAGHCAGAAANTSDCRAILESLQKTDRERNWSTVGFVVGGAALVGTAAYWFWPRKHGSASNAGWRIDGTVANGTGEIVLAGNF
jgi:hypothetical protein